MVNTNLASRAESLVDHLRNYRGVAVALSGGVDSAVVAQASYLALGNRAVAFTADSPSVARRDLQDAIAVARQIGIRHELIQTTEFADENYLRNQGDRCYYCKSNLYDTLIPLLPQYQLEVICSGANVDDLGDYRPGLTAAAERGVRHPLQELGFRKKEIRDLAQYWNLPVFDKPASPCLSSRLAPGLEVTPERTLRVEKAESFLRSLGLADCRVRYHEGDLARIEVPIENLVWFTNPQLMAQVHSTLKELGFKFVTLDLGGLRSGSLNDLVSLTFKNKFHLKQS
ncbi:MAG: ATP-dependent sacrificial sulfur transferase LarE [Gemmataceae bacterium]|jgi:uncharacterized protein|nr:ATP-dependent sacrificial sulfur transferase LarE [Gemmataceae bacterium]